MAGTAREGGRAGAATALAVMAAALLLTAPPGWTAEPPLGDPPARVPVGAGFGALPVEVLSELAETLEPPVTVWGTGRASFYHDSLAGRPTASGERYRPRAFTAAHRRLPFGTRVRVVNLANDRAVEVVVNDRGPFHGGRVIDLSRAAAERLGMIEDGVARVRIEILEE